MDRDPGEPGSRFLRDPNSKNKKRDTKNMDFPCPIGPIRSMGPYTPVTRVYLGLDSQALFLSIAYSEGK